MTERAQLPSFLQNASEIPNPFKENKKETGIGENKLLIKDLIMDKMNDRIQQMGI